MEACLDEDSKDGGDDMEAVMLIVLVLVLVSVFVVVLLILPVPVPVVVVDDDDDDDDDDDVILPVLLAVDDGDSGHDVFRVLATMSCAEASALHASPVRWKSGDLRHLECLAESGGHGKTWVFHLI